MSCPICGPSVHVCRLESHAELAGTRATFRTPACCQYCGSTAVEVLPHGVRCPACAIRQQVTPAMERLGAMLTNAIARGPVREVRGAA